MTATGASIQTQTSVASTTHTLATTIADDLQEPQRVLIDFLEQRRAEQIEEHETSLVIAVYSLALIITMFIGGKFVAVTR